MMSFSKPRIERSNLVFILFDGISPVAANENLAYIEGFGDAVMIDASSQAWTMWRDEVNRARRADHLGMQF